MVAVPTEASPEPAQLRLYGVTSIVPVLPHVFNQLRSLAFRWKSPLRKALSDIAYARVRGTIVWVEDAGRVLAWGLLVWRSETAPEIMLYTRTTEQGKGHARLVFWALRHTLGEGPNANYVYYAHDPKSSRFYQRRFEERQAGTMPRPAVTWLEA